MDLIRIMQIDEKIDKTHQTLGDSPNVMIDFQAMYNDIKFLILTIESLNESLKKSESKCKHLSTSLHRTKQERDAAKVKWKDQMNYASRVKSSMKQLQRQLDYAERQLHKRRGRK